MNYSTYKSVMMLYSKISKAIEKGKITIDILLDLEKAFDTVDQKNSSTQ